MNIKINLEDYDDERLTIPEIPYDLENIVISGGGTKGYAFVGSLKVSNSDIIKLLGEF